MDMWNKLCIVEGLCWEAGQQQEEAGGCQSWGAGLRVPIWGTEGRLSECPVEQSFLWPSFGGTRNLMTIGGSKKIIIIMILHSSLRLFLGMKKVPCWQRETLGTERDSIG